MYGESLFRLGIGLLCGAGGIGLLSVVVFAITGKKLSKQLELEYGKRRHV